MPEVLQGEFDPYPDQCVAKVYDPHMGRSFRFCQKRGTKNGYCGIHHPDAVAIREAKKQEKRDAIDAKYQAAWDRQKEDKKRLELFPELVKRLEEIRAVQDPIILEVSEFWQKVDKLLAEVPK